MGRNLVGVIRQALSAPGILRVFLASVVGRLPMGAVGLIFILRTEELTGSFAAGGVVAGASAIAHGLGAPLIGRLVDRRGQTAVLVGTGAVFLAALTGFALLPPEAPLGAAVATATIAGIAFPPVGAALRALWASQIEDEDMRHAVFAFESAVFEIVYLAAPLVFVAGIASWSLPAAAIAAGVLGAAGAWLFAAADASRAWRSAHRSTDWAGPLRGPAVRVLIGALMILGVAVGAVEIAVAAFTGVGAAAAILSLWGVGSLIGGIAAARTRAPSDPAWRLTWVFGALAAGTAPLALAGDTRTLAVLIVIAGLGIAPALATAFGLLGQVAPPGTVTEAYTWVSTGFGAGIAAGSALGGWAVEASGTTLAFLLAAAAAAGAAVVVALGRDVLRAGHRGARAAVPAPAPA